MCDLPFSYDYCLAVKTFLLYLQEQEDGSKYSENIAVFTKQARRLSQEKSREARVVVLQVNKEVLLPDSLYVLFLENGKEIFFEASAADLLIPQYENARKQNRRDCDCKKQTAVGDQ
jgi:hypothetical protein